MKSLLTIIATLLFLAATSMPISAQSGDFDLSNLKDGETPIGGKFWICCIGSTENAVTSVRLDTITSVSKHSYYIEGVLIREVTIDTAGNNSIRIYCLKASDAAARAANRTRQTRELVEGRTGISGDIPTKKFPEGTYSHNIEYQVRKVDDLDTIYNSVMNAILRNKGCALKVK